MNRFALLILLLFIGSKSYSQKDEIERYVNDFIVSEELTNASISIAIRDDEGKIIGEKNNLTSLPAASTAKLFATASALEILGPNYKAKTRIYIEGNITTEGILNGNIWIRGGGDPTLGSKFFNEPNSKMDFLQRWIEAIESAGIKRITAVSYTHLTLPTNREV